MLSKTKLFALIALVSSISPILGEMPGNASLPWYMKNRPDNIKKAMENPNRVIKTADNPGVSKEYYKGKHSCCYSISDRVTYICFSENNSMISGSYKDNESRGKYSEAKQQFDALECEWCQENKQTAGGDCTPCTTQSK